MSWHHCTSVHRILVGCLALCLMSYPFLPRVQRGRVRLWWAHQQLCVPPRPRQPKVVPRRARPPWRRPKASPPHRPRGQGRRPPLDSPCPSPAVRATPNPRQAPPLLQSPALWSLTALSATSTRSRIASWTTLRPTEPFWRSCTLTRCVGQSLKPMLQNHRRYQSEFRKYIILFRLFYQFGHHFDV